MSEQPLPASTRAIYAAFDYAELHRDQLINLLLAGVLVGVLASGFHIVKKEEAGVVVRFGRVIADHTPPGIHYHIPIIDKVRVFPVKRIATYRISSTGGQGGNFSILSGDPALFEIDVVVQYTISNLRAFLYASTDPIALTELVIRGRLVNLVGQNFIDLIFTTNRGLIERTVREEAVAELEPFGVGVNLVSVNILEVRPIDETVDAFHDVTDAVAESIQAVSEANRRRERVVLRSQGRAEAVLLAAEAKARERRVQARSSADAFNELLAAFRDEPRQVTITRYWNRMRTVFGQSTLAAVSPSGTSSIDVNLLDAPSREQPVSIVSADMPRERVDARRPLVSTAPAATHGLERSDKALHDGRFHDRSVERDHMSTASPRSLLFDTLSIFEHREVPPTTPFAAQQTEERALTAESDAEASSGRARPEQIVEEPAPAAKEPPLEETPGEASSADGVEGK
ncbi:MAG: protease modulator HflK [Bryobacterales bacterium]|nr:protease modulator HflK [Bryobacterales bacterium]